MEHDIRAAPAASIIMITFSFFNNTENCLISTTAFGENLFKFFFTCVCLNR